LRNWKTICPTLTEGFDFPRREVDLCREIDPVFLFSFTANNNLPRSHQFNKPCSNYKTLFHKQKQQRTEIQDGLKLDLLQA